MTFSTPNTALLSRSEISRRAILGMIDPFVSTKVRDGGISYGLTETGYDLRLSSIDFRLITGNLDKPIDPLNFDAGRETTRLPLQEDDNGLYFVMPPHSYALGVAVEKLVMPNDVLAIAVGKSTYARVGVIANITPIEPGWHGYLTLEFCNGSNAPVRLYANKGIVQLLFYHCETGVAYNGKYQGQANRVTPACGD
jgi:dCTP deaminase